MSLTILRKNWALILVGTVIFKIFKCCISMVTLVLNNPFDTENCNNSRKCPCLLILNLFQSMLKRIHF